MNMNIGLEVLNPKTYSDVSLETAMDELLFSSTDLNSAINELSTLSKSYETLTTVLNALDKYGYTSSIGAIFNIAELNTLLKLDVRTATHQQIKAAISSEDMGDEITKFFSRIATSVNKVLDSMGNFIRTSLPFKERYVKKIVEYKNAIQGKKFNAERFKSYTVPGTSKYQWGETIRKRKELLESLKTLVRSQGVGTEADIDTFLEKLDNTEINRFGAYMGAFAPWLTRVFGKKKLGALDWEPGDTIKVIDDTLRDVDSLHEFVHGSGGEWYSTFYKMQSQISRKRAEGNKEEAIKLRENLDLFWSFTSHMSGAIQLYSILMRKLLYFATSMGKAAKSSIIY